MNQLDILYFNIAGLSTNYVALRQIVEEKRPFLVLRQRVTHLVLVIGISDWRKEYLQVPERNYTRPI